MTMTEHDFYDENAYIDPAITAGHVCPECGGDTGEDSRFACHQCGYVWDAAYTWEAPTGAFRPLELSAQTRAYLEVLHDDIHVQAGYVYTGAIGLGWVADLEADTLAAGLED